jgi:hypothetical protein
LILSLPHQGFDHAAIPKICLARFDLEGALVFLEGQRKVPPKGEIKAEVEYFLG